MKKIIIILSLFILASCNMENKIEKDNVSDKNVEIINDEVILDNEIDNKKITISDLENNISKLKDIDLGGEDLRMLNEQAIGMFNNSVINKAVKNGDEKICEKLDKNNINNCKKQVFVEIGEIDKCDIFTNTGSVNNCKNEIIFNKSTKNLDEKICEGIIDNSEQKYEINNCKKRVFENKAIKTLDEKICEKIESNNGIEGEDRMQIDMCIEMVKMQKNENKLREEQSIVEEEIIKEEEKQKL